MILSATGPAGEECEHTVDLATLRSAVMAISDPVKRAQMLSRVIAEQQEVLAEAAQLRRAAILEARDAGTTQDEIARSLGVTPGRVSQMVTAAK
jgi:DNA-directed RNA polymerase specialized sigma24 family protein